MSDARVGTFGRYLAIPTRLAIFQATVYLATASVGAAMAPPLLLLDDDLERHVAAIAVFLGFFLAVCCALASWVLARPFRPLLASLEVESTEIDPRAAIELYRLPARLALGAVWATLAFSLVAFLATGTDFDPFHRLSISVYSLMFVTAAALPAYVAMRRVVRGALERLPPEVTVRALARLGAQARGRTRERLLGAVAAPVALVGWGCMLLVLAHARSAEIDAVRADAVAAAHVAFEPLGTTPAATKAEGEARARGARDALAQATRFGLRLERDDEAREDAVMVANRDVVVHVGLPPGSAVVHAPLPELPEAALVLALLAAAAAALAGLVGGRAGAAFDADVALARREIRGAGAAGAPLAAVARFAELGRLLRTVDRLGGVFREFARTERRATETRAAAERTRALFLAAMSHDLKGPLNAILGFSELARRTALNAAQQESLAIIVQRGRELLHLVDTILASGRAEAGELALEISRYRGADVVLAAVAEARELVEGSKATLATDLPRGALDLLVDPERAVQALVAMISTAVRFSGGGVVTVRVTSDEDGAAANVDVETPGDALPHAQRDRLFDASKDAKAARRHGALGLELGLARGIARLHGGRLDVRSLGGAALAFRLVVPLAPPPETERTLVTAPQAAPDAGTEPTDHDRTPRDRPT